MVSIEGSRLRAPSPSIQLGIPPLEELPRTSMSAVTPATIQFEMTDIEDVGSYGGLVGKRHRGRSKWKDGALITVDNDAWGLGEDFELPGTPKPVKTLESGGSEIVISPPDN